MWTFPLFSFFDPGDRGPIWVIGSVYLVQPLFLPVPSLKHDSRGPVQVPQVACRLRWVMLIAKVWSMTDRNQTFVPGKIIELVLKANETNLKQRMNCQRSDSSRDNPRLGRPLSDSHAPLAQVSTLIFIEAVSCTEHEFVRYERPTTHMLVSVYCNRRHPRSNVGTNSTWQYTSLSRSSNATKWTYFGGQCFWTFFIDLNCMWVDCRRIQQ